MKKKLILGLAAIVVVVGGVAAMSAYEAHVINVTAHIENALTVDTTPIEFGTVFPQEYVEHDFTVAMSKSFYDAERVEDIEYVIKQKPKCICSKEGIEFEECEEGEYAPVDYATHKCPEYFDEMLSLCPFLSKMDADPEDANDESHRSYFQDDHCLTTPDPDAVGYLSKIEGDIKDLWTVDLKVPPVDGFVGQDWPAGCPTVPDNDKNYGCDLWIEVTYISENFVD